MELWVPGSALDRVGDQRVDDAWVRSLWESPAARLLTLSSDLQVWTRSDALDLVAAAGSFSPEEHLLVGVVGSQPVFVVVEDATTPRADTTASAGTTAGTTAGAGEGPGGAATLGGGRDGSRTDAGREGSGADGRRDGSRADGGRDGSGADERAGVRRRSARDALSCLDETERDVLATALALTQWNARSVHCGDCGTRTEVRQAGHVRWCPRCRRDHFPRIDPAVICAVVDAQDRLLLAHNTAWPQERMSLLAGFVDAGESLEQCVHREVGEESGLALGAVSYVSSQPWPFPRSLMLGFVGRAAGDDIRVDGVEIDRARFFTRAEYADALQRGRLAPPGPTSIAGSLIRLWREGRLPAPEG